MTAHGGPIKLKDNQEQNWRSGDILGGRTHGELIHKAKQSLSMTCKNGQEFKNRGVAETGASPG